MRIRPGEKGTQYPARGGSRLQKAILRRSSPSIFSTTHALRAGDNSSYVAPHGLERESGRAEQLR